MRRKGGIAEFVAAGVALPRDDVSQADPWEMLSPGISSRAAACQRPHLAVEPLNALGQVAGAPLPDGAAGQPEPGGYGRVGHPVGGHEDNPGAAHQAVGQRREEANDSSCCRSSTEKLNGSLGRPVLMGTPHLQLDRAHDTETAKQVSITLSSRSRDATLEPLFDFPDQLKLLGQDVQRADASAIDGPGPRGHPAMGVCVRDIASIAPPALIMGWDPRTPCRQTQPPTRIAASMM